MTCIAAWADSKNVWIGADSAGVAPDHSLTVRADEKVFGNGEIIFGCAGSFRVMNLLRFALKVPDKPKRMDDYRYMCTLFIDAVRATMKEGGVMRKQDNLEEAHADFIAGYRGQIYMIDCDDFHVGRPADWFAAVGCGDNVALGAFYALKTNTQMTPKQRIMTALEASERFSGGVRRPFRVITS